MLKDIENLNLPFVIKYDDEKFTVTNEKKDFKTSKNY